MLDYDIFYQSLNTAAVLGTMQLPALWNLSFDAERRNAPVLTTQNALIGQPFGTLDELAQFYQSIGLPTDAIYENARANTSTSNAYSVTVSRPLGPRYQFSATVSAQQFGATSGVGTVVPAQQASGLQVAYQAQLYGSSIWKEGDFNVLSVLYADTQTVTTYSASVTERFPLGAAWRLGPRFAVVHQQIASDGSNQLSLVPSALLDWQRGRNLMQFEGGYEFGKRDASLQTQNTRRYYVSLSYRIAF